MAVLVRSRTRTRAKGRGRRELAICLALGALLLAGGIALYQRERRLEAKRRFEQEHFIRMHDQRMTDGMTEAERREYFRDIEELKADARRKANH